MTVAHLRTVITHKEFEMWVEFFEWEDTRTTKEDWYLAALTAEVRRSWVKNPNKVKTSNFLLRFNQRPQPDAGKSKAVWMSALGIKDTKHGNRNTRLGDTASSPRKRRD